MLTKKDLSAIKALFDTRFDSMDIAVKDISERLDSNTKELTDLILAGFATHEPMLAGHERRLTRLEKECFKSN